MGEIVRSLQENFSDLRSRRTELCRRLEAVRDRVLKIVSGAEEFSLESVRILMLHEVFSNARGNVSEALYEGADYFSTLAASYAIDENAILSLSDHSALGHAESADQRFLRYVTEKGEGLERHLSAAERSYALEASETGGKDRDFYGILSVTAKTCAPTIRNIHQELSKPFLERVK